MGMMLVKILTPVGEVPMSYPSEKSLNQERILRTAFMGINDLTSIDTCEVKTISEYRILDSLYSPLVQISRLDGQLYSSAAKQYSYESGWLNFELRDDIVTIDGYQVTASDAEFSFKRLLLCGDNSHGKLHQFLDIGPINDIKDDVDGIKVIGNTLSIRYKAEVHLVLAFLSSIDFAIIPKIAVNPDTLKISEFRNTSGPYFVEEAQEPYIFAFTRNRNHWSLSPSSPDRILFLRIDTQSKMIDAFNQNKIDFIGPNNQILPPILVDAISKNETTQIHKSQPLLTWGIFPTDIAKKRHANELVAFGKWFRTIFANNFIPKMNKHEKLFVSTDSIFIENSFGSLTPLQRKEYEHALKTSDMPNQKIRVAVRHNFVNELRETFKDSPELIEFIPSPTGQTPQELRQNQDFDFFLFMFDVANHEDTALIGYGLTIGAFKTEKPTEFLKSYLIQENEENREAMIKNLHINSIYKDPVILPVARMSFVGVAQNGWKMPFPASISGMPLFNLELKKNRN